MLVNKLVDHALSAEMRERHKGRWGVIGAGLILFELEAK